MVVVGEFQVRQGIVVTLARIFLVLLVLAAGIVVVGFALLFGSDPLCD